MARFLLLTCNLLLRRSQNLASEVRICLFLCAALPWVAQYLTGDADRNLSPPSSSRFPFDRVSEVLEEYCCIFNDRCLTQSLKAAAFPVTTHAGDRKARTPFQWRLQPCCCQPALILRISTRLKSAGSYAACVGNRLQSHCSTGSPQSLRWGGCELLRHLGASLMRTMRRCLEFTLPMQGLMGSYRPEYMLHLGRVSQHLRSEFLGAKVRNCTVSLS